MGDEQVRPVRAGQRAPGGSVAAAAGGEFADQRLGIALPALERQPGAGEGPSGCAASRVASAATMSRRAASIAPPCSAMRASSAVSQSGSGAASSASSRLRSRIAAS